MEMLLTTRISLNPSTRNLSEQQLQTLRERLLLETKNFLDQVSTSDGDAETDGHCHSTYEEDPVVPQLSENEDSEEGNCELHVAATEKQTLDTNIVEGTVAADEVTECAKTNMKFECQQEEASGYDNCMSDEPSCLSVPQDVQHEYSLDSNQQLALMLRKREQLLQQKRSAITTHPPALIKSSVSMRIPSVETETRLDASQDRETREADTGTEVCRAPPVPPSSAADAMIESLREVSSLQPKLGDIDRLSLSMKANASRILAQFSIPLPLGEGASTGRKRRREVSRRQESRVPYTPGYPYAYPPRHPQQFPLQDMPYLLGGLPVYPQFGLPPQFLNYQESYRLSGPPLAQLSPPVHIQESTIPISNIIRGATPTYAPESRGYPLPSHTEQYLLTPERYFQQIAAAVPPIRVNMMSICNPPLPPANGYPTSDSQRNSQLEMEDGEEKRHKEQLRRQMEGAEGDGDVSSQSGNSRSVSSREVSPVDNRDGETESSVAVQSLMATSGQHRVNIRRFMSRLPAEFRRKLPQTSTATDKAKCDVCGKVMARKGLMVHRRIHVGDKRFKCEICGRSFTQACNMRTHLKVHLQVREHRCSHCGKVFSRAQHLYEHERIHTGERPYVCRFCGCSFKAYSTLYSHIGTHTGHKYECQVCHRTFAKACNLETHIRSKHPEESRSVSFVATPLRVGGSESSSRDSVSPEAGLQP